MSDLPKHLRIKASVMNMGERIAWGSDTALMEQAADLIEQQQARIAELEEQLIIQTKRGDLASPAIHTACDFKDLHDKVCKERDELAATVDRFRSELLEAAEIIDESTNYHVLAESLRIVAKDHNDD